MVQESNVLELNLFRYKARDDAAIRFRIWHVEPLLNQAADLLDRCLRDREEYYALHERYDLLRLEQDSTRSMLDLVQKQIDRNFFAWEETQATTEVNGRNALQAKYADAAENYRVYRVKIEDDEGEWPHVRYGIRAQEVQAEIGRDHNSLEITLKGSLAKHESERRGDRLVAHQNSVRSHQQKEELIKSAGGSLNFSARLDALRERIDQDFKDAYDRMSVAKEGLAAIYGYSEGKNYKKFPTNDPEADGFGPIDAAVLWVRGAISWMVAFNQLDQGWTVCASIRQLVGESQWNSTVQSGGESATFEFEIPAGRFKDHAYIRLRGMSLVARSNASSEQLYNGKIRLPERALVTHTGDSTNDTVELRQDTLPICVFGRIDTRQSPRPPEVVGAVSLVNASPIAVGGTKWFLSVSDLSGGSLTALEDLTLELSLLGRPIISV